VLEILLLDGELLPIRRGLRLPLHGRKVLHEIMLVAQVYYMPSGGIAQAHC